MVVFLIIGKNKFSINLTDVKLTFSKFGSQFDACLETENKKTKYGNELFNSCRSNYAGKLVSEFYTKEQV